MTFQVFISYKSEYRDFARKVQSQLRQWGYRTWFDMDDIPKGAYFRHEIQKGLDGSDVLVGVMTQEAFDSREVMAEWDYFLAQDKELLPLKYRDCKPLYHLVTIQWIDFVNDEASGFSQLEQRLKQLASEPTLQMHERPLEELNLSPSTLAKLKRVGITGIGDVLDMVERGRDAWLAMRDFDEQSLNEVISRLKETGYLREEAAAPEPADKLDDLILEKPKPAAPITPPLSMPAPAAPPQQTLDRKREPEVVDGLPAPVMIGRRSRAGWLRPALAVASLVVVVGIVALMVLLNSGPSPSPPIAVPEPGISPLIPLAGLLIVAAAVYFVRSRGVTLFGGVEDAQATQQLNRQRMLDKVEEFWIRGVLDKALEAGRLELGLAAAPGMVLRHKDYGDYALPKEASILDVFNDLNRELLILGAPGAGKTVLMLQLAEKLIEQARSPRPPAPSPTLRGSSTAGRGGVNPTPQSPPHVQGGEANPTAKTDTVGTPFWASVQSPIPVVFNLSSWAAERKPLAEWLADELRLKYQVPKKVAKEWVESEQLLLLLDGLDEVNEQYRNDCVEAINTFRQQYRAVDLAVCSRIADYELLTRQLDLRGAVALEPLSQAQIDSYLNRPELAGLNTVLATDSALQDMAGTPFLLNVMAYAYKGMTASELRVFTTDYPRKARRKHLFDRWVEKRLGLDDPTQLPYTVQHIRHYLTWLANKMVTFRKTTFYIEELQPQWLVYSEQQMTYQLADEIIFRLRLILRSGLISGIVVNVLDSLISGVPGFRDRLEVNMLIGLLIGFGITLADWYLSRSKARLIEAGRDVDGLTARGSIDGRIIDRQTFYMPRDKMSILPIEVQNKELLDTSTRPNQLILNSVYKSLVIVLIMMLILLLICFILLGSIPIITFLAIAGFIIVWRDKSAIQHLILRLILWRSGDAPLNYALFLDYCASAGLLRKVGGGYIFAHRYLLEYFAEQ